ncbi:MAG TPA: hypothetical protein VD913_05630, partial [bacterium]|nr:hypothetical protein [bacterium]
VSAKVDGVQKSIVDRKKAVFNPELQSFDLALTDFREGKKADKFLPSLLQMAQANGVDLADLDQVMLFEQTLVAEKALSKEKLDSEAQRLMQSFKRNRLSFEELLRSGKIPADKLEAYPESKQYLALMHLQDQIDHREFFSQIDEAISRVKERLFTSDEEKALDARSERFLLAKKIILFQATPDDLKAYEVQQSEIDSEIASDGLSEPLNLGLGFYEIAKKRDKIFFEKITSDERLGGDIAVVTGGFHTEGLSEKMKEAGISYAVVTPDLANEAPNEKLYFQRLQQNMVSMQTLSEMRNRIFATTPENQEVTVFDSAFPLAVIRIQETKNIREGTSLIENAFSEGAALTGPGIRRAAVAGLAPGITDQDFINFTPQERLEAFQRWADSSEKSETSIFLVLEGKSLTEALQDPINQESVEIFKQNANNSAVVLGTDFPTDILGGRSRVLIKSDVNTVEDFMQEPIADIRLKQVNNHAAGLEGELLKEGRILVLPVKIKGELLRGILIVASAVARGEVQISSDPEIQSQFWSAVQELIAQYPTLEALRTAA